MNKKWLLVILLIASVSFNFVLLTLPESPKDTPVGTYQAVVDDVDVIIAIESDGNYCIYKPNDSVIQKGKYTEKGNVLTLDGNAKDIMYHSDEDIIYNLDKNRFAAQTDKQTRDFEVRSRGSTFTFFCGTIYVLRKAVQHY